MKPEFSESSYAFSLVNEMAKKHPFNVAPIFPSLYEEGRTGGYDTEVNIQGTPFFFQFKVSDYLSRSNATHYRTFNDSYYQFHLHARKKSKQHDLLLHLENSGNPVFYVAPRFYKHNDLNMNFRNSNMVSESIWITAKEIGALPDDDLHSVCFNKNNTLVYLFSEPRQINSKFSSLNNISDDLNGFNVYFDYFRMSSSYEKYHKDTWEGLFNQMVYIINKHSGNNSLGKENIKKYINDINSIKSKCAFLSRLFFGAEMLILNT
ncbi:hypothetical protein ACS8E3_05240 [Psychrobacter sp. 2Y5]|uniref:hypothetical protein n=1 Tax=unclassified Psychrobacter TaxID=196806 RepID=UPI003F45E458